MRNARAAQEGGVATAVAVREAVTRRFVCFKTLGGEGGMVGVAFGYGIPVVVIQRFKKIRADFITAFLYKKI